MEIDDFEGVTHQIFGEESNKSCFTTTSFSHNDDRDACIDFLEDKDHFVVVISCKNIVLAIYLLGLRNIQE